MSTPSANRILGLSPRARRYVIPFLAIAAVIVAITYLSSRKSDEPSGTGPVVGGDLHAAGELGSRLFVGGHGGAGYCNSAGGWTQIESLDDTDVMGWASAGSKVLAGGHTGLYGSTDGGTSFEPRSTAGRGFMGTIWIDPTNPDIAIAPSMQDRAVRTTDGGTNWTPLGSASRSMAVAVDNTGSRLLAIGMDSKQPSDNGGASRTALDVPDHTSAASYTSPGELVMAALANDRADLHQQVSGDWDPLR